jgi:hypothetical protein
MRAAEAKVGGGSKDEGRIVCAREDGKKIGYIPKHPQDVEGKPPLNGKDGVLVFQEKKGKEIAEVKAEPKKLEIVRNVPAGYESNWTKNAPKAEKPVITGKVLKNGTEPWSVVAAKAGSQKVGTPAIRYDYKTKNFVAATTNGVASGKGKQAPVVVAHVGASYGGGNSPRASKQNAGGGHAGSAGSGGGNARGAEEETRGEVRRARRGRVQGAAEPEERLEGHRRAGEHRRRMRRREAEVVVRGSRARHQRRRPVLEGRIEWNAITRGKRKKERRTRSRHAGTPRQRQEQRRRKSRTLKTQGCGTRLIG